MTHMTTRRGNGGRLFRIAAIAVSIPTMAACSDFLVADNPGAIQEPDVNNVAYVNLLANAPVFGFQIAYDDAVWWNGQFADEIVNNNGGNPFVEEGQIDRRELYSDMSYIGAFMYSPLQRARFLAEDASRRLETIMPDSAASDLRNARSYALAGYSYVALGETMCVTPIDLGVPKSSEEMFTDAVTRFNSAITIAQAYKAKVQARVPLVAAAVNGADSVINLARVGAARASLGKNDKAAAAAFAAQVPANFEYHLWYSSNTSAQHHRTYNRIGLTSTNGWLRGTPFEAMLGDPRIPRVSPTTSVARQGVPLSPLMYSTHNGTVAGAPFLADMSHKLATGLEARYIVAEVAGPTAAATLAFVNERRAVGLQAPVNLTGAALMAELRDQRSRDFYLAGQRLGDLRRYKRYENIDLFPKGPYPGSTTGQVYDESITCWPLPRVEINANPNVD